MKPQNHSERKNSIFRFWAIYIVALLFPMTTFYFLFKNSGGGGEDYKKLQRQIAEFEALTIATTKLDSLTKKMYDTDKKLISNPSVTERSQLIQDAEQAINDIKGEVFPVFDKGMKDAKSSAVKQFIKDIKGILISYIHYHNAFMEYAKRDRSEGDKNNELAQIQLEKGQLNREIGQLKGEVEYLKTQLANCKPIVNPKTN